MWLAHNLSQKGGSTKSMSGFSASRAGGSEATKRRSEALTKKMWGEFLEAKDQKIESEHFEDAAWSWAFLFFLNLLLVYIYINTQWQCLSSLFHEIGDPVGYK